jgi:16S rRNA (uracil1498-N3)-methyltransferase
MHRFFVPPEVLKTNDIDIPLPKDLAHQVRDVLRLNLGEQLLLLDNSGDEILAAITKTSKTAVEVHLLERRPGKSEPPVRIVLCQGLMKSARFEWILEKGTELGVSVLSPIICSRSTAGLEDAGLTKLHRWKRIIQEATEQSGRSRLPELLPIRPMAQALTNIPPNAIAIMPWEQEHTLTLRDVLSTSIRLSHGALNSSATRNVGPLAGARFAVARPNPPQHPTAPAPLSPTIIVLFIGPEGGLTAEEVALAKQHDVQIVTLGSRILRAETAALATVANILYEFQR